MGSCIKKQGILLKMQPEKIMSQQKQIQELKKQQEKYEDILKRIEKLEKDR
ncbi:MAG: hypothetical protein ACOC5F_00855 [Candidatus Aminicenantaceae bacterium]